MIERMRWKSSSVKSIRDARTRNSPPISGSPIVFSGWALLKNQALRKVFYTQILKNAFEVFLTYCD